MNRSGKCEIFLLWFFTLVYDYIWPKTNFTKKIFFDHQKFLWRLLETLHDIHGFSCLGTVKQAIKTHQKCIFQPLHNEVKSVLGIKESYSMEKSPKIFTNRSGSGWPHPHEAVSLTADYPSDGDDDDQAWNNPSVWLMNTSRVDGRL